MSFYNTGNPVPSIDPRDLDDNAKHIDEIANSTFPTFVDRRGTTRLTLAGIEAQVPSVLSLPADLANQLDLAKGATLVGYMGRTVRQKLNEAPSVLDYPSIADAETAVGVVGGTLTYPAGTYPGDPAQTIGNVLRHYKGPNSIGSIYAPGDALAVGANVLKYSDATDHVAKEGYTLLIESRPKGSTDGTVPGSDFALGSSIVKQNWQNSQVEGQVCGLNTVSRGGYFLSPKVITGITQANPAVVTSNAHGYVNGDIIIIQNVLGMFQVNELSKFTVAGATANTFQLAGVDSTAFAAYISGGIAHKNSGVAGFYNPGDTATYIANTVQSSANGFSAQFEGASYYMPSGSFIAGTVGIRVQLGAIKKAEGIAVGVLAVASNGSCGAAFQAQNSRADVGIEGVWTKAFSYNTDFGSGPYEAFQINQLGQIVLHGGTSATTPKKTIRSSQSTGRLEVINDANSAVIFSVSDAGAVDNPLSYSVQGTKVVGVREFGYTAFTGATNKATSYATGTVTLVQLAERVAALQASMTTHGLVGA